MADITRIALFHKLNSLLYKSIESATSLCKLRGNSHVELVHWLNQIYQLQNSDLVLINRHFDINESRLVNDLTQALNQLPGGASSVSDISTHIDQAVQEAWLYTSLAYNESRIRSAHLLLGILKEKTLVNVLLVMSAEFKKINPEILSEQLIDIIEGSPECTAESESQSALADGAQDEVQDTALEGQDALKRYTLDLTAQAKDGKLDPVVGRDREIRQLIDILMRRRQNNPILTGEAGVGKTAVVEGFALRVAEGDVPPSLQGVSIRVLDLGLLQAGASVKGAFEQRLKEVIESVKLASTPTILFIDEAHTLIGAGGQAGTGDAANLLKPELARGSLRTIAATTWSEYKKYIEKDPALTRRFQVVKIEEPEEEMAVAMLRGLQKSLSEHHKVPTLESALEAAVNLSKRYIPDRQLPDKAVSLLDTACARVALSQYTEPAQLEDKKKRLSRLVIEYDYKFAENEKGIRCEDILNALNQQICQVENDIEALNEEWLQQKELVGRVVSIENHLAEEDDEETLKQLKAQLDDRHKLHGLVFPYVDERIVAEVVSGWTGIPLGHMVEDARKQLLELEERLGSRIFGQEQSLALLADQIRISRSGLGDPDAPMGVFLLAGSSGVGKTETALALADILYGGEQNLITINMSEFQESHTVSTLKGAPPGYVGYGEGGVLTEAVRRKPYSVILLDEIEKAHPDVHEIFFQVFDRGWMEDGEGRYIDFKNTLILLTSNVGSEALLSTFDEEKEQEWKDIESAKSCIVTELRAAFPDALLGRLNIVPFLPLSSVSVKAIVEAKLGKVLQRFSEQYKLPVDVDADIYPWLMSLCQVRQSGARLIGNIINHHISSRLSEFALCNLSSLESLQSVCLNRVEGNAVSVTSTEKEQSQENIESN